jgi:hypothetical protein
MDAYPSQFVHTRESIPQKQLVLLGRPAGEGIPPFPPMRTSIKPKHRESITIMEVLKNKNI